MKTADEVGKMLDRSKSFGCYVSSDGKHVTGWKGNILGAVVGSWKIPCAFGRSWDYLHGKNRTHYVIRDLHGNFWHGNSSPGVCITLRPMKGVQS